MKVIKLLRRPFVLVLAALIVLCLSFSAFADDNSFILELDRSFKIKDISVLSNMNTCLSLKDVLARDMSGINGKEAAESIAHTLFLNEQATEPVQDSESGTLCFPVIGPAIFAFAEDKAVESSSAYKINVVAVDVADGTKLRTELWQENSREKNTVDYISCGSCVVKDSLATMTIGKKMIQELEKDSNFKAVIYYDYEGYGEFVTEHEFKVVDAEAAGTTGGAQGSGWTPPTYVAEGKQQSSGTMPWEQDWKHDWQGSLENTLDFIGDSGELQLPPWLDVDIIKQRSADDFDLHVVLGGKDYGYGEDSGFGIGYSGEGDSISFSIEGITISIPMFWKK